MQGVLIADYDPAWPSLFEELRERVGNTLGPIVITIEHVGSTSVPNLPAKPIIDLDVVVRPEDVPAAIATLEQLGYQHEGNLGIDGREAFRWVANVPEHHLYLCPEGSAAFRRHIILRDYLRAHSDEAREYAALKRKLAAQFHDNRSKYQDAKADFVDSLMKKAAAAAEERGTRNP